MHSASATPLYFIFSVPWSCYSLIFMRHFRPDIFAFPSSKQVPLPLVSLLTQKKSPNEWVFSSVSQYHPSPARDISPRNIGHTTLMQVNGYKGRCLDWRHANQGKTHKPFTLLLNLPHHTFIYYRDLDLGGWDVAQMVEFLRSMREALGFNPQYCTKKAWWNVSVISVLKKWGRRIRSSSTSPDV